MWEKIESTVYNLATHKYLGKLDFLALVKQTASENKKRIKTVLLCLKIDFDINENIISKHEKKKKKKYVYRES